jgi:stage II sporulation protein D
VLALYIFMSHLLTIAALLCSPASNQETARINVLGLFKPQIAHARLRRGGSLEISGLAHSIGPGDLIRIRRADGRLDITVMDSFGRLLRSLKSSEAQISGAGAIEVTLPGRIKREFRGQIAISAPANGWLQIVVTSDREAVVASVTAAEMQSRSTEALKAMAVLARSFMISHPARHRGEGFDFCDTTHCQLYRGETDLENEARRLAVTGAVSATEGEFLSFDRCAVETYFTAVCGGLSATPALVWGGATGSRYRHQRVQCRWCRRSPYMNWERQAAASAILDALSSALGSRLSQDAEIAVQQNGDEPARSVIISDRGRLMEMSVEAFRRAIGSRMGWNKVLSPTFQAERRGQRFVFRGRGFGSQVGLCLEGAARQSEAGRSYRDILLFYFPQAEIGKERGICGQRSVVSGRWSVSRSPLFHSPIHLIISSPIIFITGNQTDGLHIWRKGNAGESAREVDRAWRAWVVRHSPARFGVRAAAGRA